MIQELQGYKKYVVADTFCTEQGCTIANLRLTGRKSSKNLLEGFISNMLHVMGVKQVAGFKTRRNLGSGEMFSLDGMSMGKVKIWGRGFQRKTPTL